MNVFRKHRATELALKAATLAAGASSTGEIPRVEGSAYEQMFAQMAAHKIELKAIQSVKAKGVRKGEIIPDYTAYVDGILSANEAVQDDVVVTIFVWAIDAEELDLALEIAEWAIEHDISPPPEFTRSIASILAEEVAELALSEPVLTADYLDPLMRVSEMVKDKDMADPVRAKLFKALGYALREENPNDALVLLKDALSLHSKIGVKRDIETLEREIKKSALANADTKGLSPDPALATDTSEKDSDPVQSASNSEAEGDADANPIAADNVKQ